MFLGTNYLEFVCDIFAVEYQLAADVMGDKLLGICVRSFLQYVVCLLTHVFEEKLLGNSVIFAVEYLIADVF